jgi:hypothetical protein
VIARDAPRRLSSHVGCGDRALNGQRVQAVRREPRWIDVHAQLTRPAADERHLGDIGDFRDRVTQLCGQRPQLIVAVALRPHGDRQDRHIVNRAGPDDRTDNTRRNPIGIGGELLIEPDESRFLGFADLEADDHHRLSGGRRRIYVLDARHFPEELFQRSRDALLHVGRRRARHFDEHVYHGDDDLWLLFARQRRDGQRAERHRGGDEERRQLRVDERRRQPSGRAVRGNHQRPPALTRRPSVTVGGAATMTTSPSDNPASTSVPLTFTSRKRAMPLSTTRTDVICPRRVSALAGTVSARRG